MSARQENAAARSTRAEHHWIGVGLASIEGLLKGLTEPEPQAAQARRALRRLEHLASELEVHFASEEAADGLFAVTLGVAPRLERRVRALRTQHASLGAELEEILGDAGYAGLAPEAWRRVAVTFEGFARALRAHERLENRIVSDAYLRDLGSGD